MRVIPVKLKRILKEGFIDIRDFDGRIMLARMKCTLSDEAVECVQKKNQEILEYLKKYFSDLIYKYQVVEENLEETRSVGKAPVWVFWWQGEAEMPQSIKMCHNSKVKSINDHPLILLTKENICEYVTFPEYIWQQFYDGRLRVQHLADMVRVKLIREYGGIWLDASIYCSYNLPEEIFQLQFYSLKGEPDKRFISNNQWTTFVIGGMKGNILCAFLDDFFMEYCKSGKQFIDYFMFDCAIELAYQNIPAARKLIDQLPKAKGDCYWLNSRLEQEVTEQLIEEMERDSALFYKIAWNRSIGVHCKCNTLYQYLLEKQEAK